MGSLCVNEGYFLWLCHKVVLKPVLIFAFLLFLVHFYCLYTHLQEVFLFISVSVALAVYNLIKFVNNNILKCTFKNVTSMLLIFSQIVEFFVGHSEKKVFIYWLE